MAFVFVSAILILIWQALQSRWRLPAVLVRRTIPSQLVWCGAILLPLGYGAQLRVIDYASRNDQFASQVWLARLPMRLAFHGPALGTTAHVIVAVGIVASIFIQTLGLSALSFGMPDRYNRIAPAIVAILLAMLSVSSSVLTSADVFFYAYTSTLGLEAYTATAVPLNSPYHFLLPNVPLTGNIYGPLWTEFNAAIASLGTTMHAKIIVLRVANVAFIVIAFLLIRIMNLPRRVQIAFGLNPMLWLYFVVNAHNDIIAIVLCFSAIAIVRRYPRYAIAIIATAGAIKISYLVIGCCAFARLRSRTHLLFAASAAVLLSLSISWVIGGHGYFENLVGYVYWSEDKRSADVQFVATAFTAMALLAIGASTLTRRMFPAVAWLFPLAALAAFPWYLIWGLPYAIVIRRGLAATLLLLPIGAALSDQIYGLQSVASFVMYSFFIFITTNVIRISIQRGRTRVTS